MQIENIDHNGIELDTHEIMLRGPYLLESGAIDDATDMWGEIENSVLVTFQDKFYICDGVSPYTGRLFDQDIIEELRDTFGAANVKIL